MGKLTARLDLGEAVQDTDYKLALADCSHAELHFETLLILRKQQSFLSCVFTSSLHLLHMLPATS